MVILDRYDEVDATERRNEIVWIVRGLYAAHEGRAAGETVVVGGCMVVSALNYEPLAEAEDGSCTVRVNGCTNGTASNAAATPSAFGEGGGA